MIVGPGTSFTLVTIFVGPAVTVCVTVGPATVGPATVFVTVLVAPHPAAASSPHVPSASATRCLVMFIVVAPLVTLRLCFLVGCGGAEEYRQVALADLVRRDLDRHLDGHQVVLLTGSHQH